MATIQQKQLFDEIDILPLDLKTKLVDKILHSMNQTSDTIDDLWIEEVQKRRQDVESGDVSLVGGEEVFKKIQQRLK